MQCIIIDDEEAVSKYLRVVPPKYTQIALSIKTMLDLTGRLRAVDDRTGATTTSVGGKLLMTEEEWTARMREKPPPAVATMTSAVSRPRGRGKRRRTSPGAGHLPPLWEDWPLGQ